MLLKTITLVIVVLGLFLSFSQPLNAQRLFRQGGKIERKLERQKKVDKREYEKKRLKLIQEHIDRQSPEVQERRTGKTAGNGDGIKSCLFIKDGSGKKAINYGRVYGKFYLSAYYRCNTGFEYEKKEAG